MNSLINFEKFRIRYLSWQNNTLRTVSGFLENDIEFLFEGSKSDPNFQALVKEAIFTTQVSIKVFSVEFICREIPFGYKPGVFGYELESLEIR